MHPLKSVLKHRTVSFITDVLTDLDDIIRSDANNRSIESRMMKLAKT